MTIRQMLGGLGVVAAGPSPGDPGTNSRAMSLAGQSISLVGSLGQTRSATYRQIYLFNPWVYSSVNTIARGIARLPLHVYRLDEEARKTRVRGDIPAPPGRPSAGAALDRLLSSGARARTAGVLRDRLVQGNGLWEIVRRGGGAPVGLERVQWSRVGRVEEENDRILYYEVNVDRNGRLGVSRRTLFPEDVIHFGRGDGLDGAVGVSPLSACRHTLALHEAVMRHLMAYLGNAVRPSGHIKVEKLTEKLAAEIRASLRELYASPEQAGKVLVTSGEWQPMSDSPEHASLVELVKLSREEIATVYSVPPSELGILENAVKANVKEMRTKLVRDTYGTWAAEVESELMEQLIDPLASWRGHFVEYELAEQLRPDMEARALVYQRMAADFSIDEIRALENMPPLGIPGVSDVPWVPSGAMPITAWKDGRNPLRDRSQQQDAAANGNGNGHIELSEVT